MRARLPIIVAALSVATPVAAADRDTGWQFTLQPYLMAPAINGEVVVRGRSADIEVTRKDFFDDLNAAFVGYGEVARGDWAFGVDVNYSNLDGSPDDRRIEVDSKTTLVQPMVLYRLTDAFELVVGARYNNMSLSAESTTGLFPTQRRNREWVDPLVGFRMTQPIGANNRFIVLANVGGFDVGGSDIAVQARAMFSFGIARNVTLDAGYQLFYMDYDKGTGTDQFVYDALIDAPIVGATFTF